MAGDPAEAAASLPDLPRWAETRWLLRLADSVLSAGRAGGVVVNERMSMGAVIGTVGADALRRVIAGAPEDLELLVQMEGLEEVIELLPDWKVAVADLHLPPRVLQADEDSDPSVLVSTTLEATVLEEIGRFDDELRIWAERAEAVALRREDGQIVSICQAVVVTETLWDVGIDTVEPARRRGHATACFRTLAAHMAARGKRPIWGAYESNEASMRLAAKLGFEPVDRIAVLGREMPSD